MEAGLDTFREEGYRAGFAEEPASGPTNGTGSSLPKMLYAEGHEAGVADRVFVNDMKAAIAELITPEEFQSYSFADFSNHLEILLEYEKRDSEHESPTENAKSAAFLELVYEELKAEFAPSTAPQSTTRMRMGR